MAATGVHVVVVRNELIALKVKLRNQTEHVVADTVNAIEAEVKADFGPRIGKTVRTKRSNGGMTGKVTAGDLRKAIDAGFHEYGATTTPAHPVMTPAAERRRRRFERDIANILD